MVEPSIIISACAIFISLSSLYLNHLTEKSREEYRREESRRCKDADA